MLEELKNYLKIAWDNENDYLQNIIARGKEYLNDLTGVKLNFEMEGQYKSLLLDYCRYYYNNAIEYYPENFQRELLSLKLKEAVKDRVREDEE